MIPVLLTEEGHSTHLTSLVDRHLTELLQWDAGTDTTGDNTLDSTELFGLDLGKVSEVKAEHFVRDERSLLLDMCPEDLTKSLVQ